MTKTTSKKFPYFQSLYLGFKESKKVPYKNEILAWNQAKMSVKNLGVYSV